MKKKSIRNFITVTGILIITILSFQSCTKDYEEPIPVPSLHKIEIWAHRCNSVETAERLMHLVQGLELDVHFNSMNNRYYVKHDFTQPDTLLLSEYLTRITDSHDLKYWLDFKNLSIDNQYAALLRLNWVTDSLGIEKSQFIIEGHASSLGNFENAGYFTSYYIPTFNPLQLTDEETESMAADIRTTINTWPVNAISGYYEQLEFMQQYFPYHAKLTWFLTENTSPAVLDSIINQVNQDTTVKVLLLPESLILKSYI